MTYDDTEVRFVMEQCRDTTTGVYFIVDEQNGMFDILKVGKAEGKRGLSQRLNGYRTTGRTRLPVDRTAQLWHNVMTNQHRGSTLSVYIYPLAMTEVLIEGYTVRSSMVRSFEETLSKQARLEGNSMLLSGFD
jgi:hypothetical protein